MKRRTMALLAAAAVIAIAFVFLAPVVPSELNTGLTITCRSSPFPCQWAVYNRVPAQGRMTYHLYSSISDYLVGRGFVCSPDIGGCWWE